jgi:hypothetical protein
MCDIQVDAKVGSIVMIFANSKGRKVVESLWPDIEWTTDEIFARVHSPDWLFTHIRVTKLPPPLEERTPLAFASPDAIGCAVAMALQQCAEPRRVVHHSGQGENMKINIYNGAAFARESELARCLYAEHVPAGTVVGPPQSIQ